MIDKDSFGVIILLVAEGTSLAIGILRIGGWDSDIVNVEEENVIDDLAAWEYVCDKGGAINFQPSKRKKKLHSGVPPPTTESSNGGSVPVIWQKTRHGAYLEYTQNIVLLHQGDDPTGRPDTPYLQH
ncbi:hypothetical protein TNCV_2574311 [Trichonephila clavipes]|nr:hypothetical protein TNCV_2574311 [Trichonephila clavipes]